MGMVAGKLERLCVCVSVGAGGARGGEGKRGEATLLFFFSPLFARPLLRWRSPAQKLKFAV